MEPKQINYAKMWKILLRLGLKTRFSAIRSDFFMKLATDGPCDFCGDEKLDELINNSMFLKDVPTLTKSIKQFILPDDHFKHYEYSYGDDFFIEYFANKEKCITPDMMKASDDDKLILNPDSLSAICCSTLMSFVPDKTEGDSTDEEPQPKNFTAHVILVGEGNGKILPDEYPTIIKHELTHACIFELIQRLKEDYWMLIKVSPLWSEEDQQNWENDVKELRAFLTEKTYESEMFQEFVSEFLMYESDGYLKIQNPTPENRVKSAKADSKPKVTFSVLTPFDVFQDTIDDYPEEYGKYYQMVLNQLRPLYEDYDAFLDETK